MEQNFKCKLDSKTIELNKKNFESNLSSFSKAPLVDALEHYYNNPSVQLHIPGHTKGNAVLPKFRELIGQKALYLDTTDEFNNLGTLHPASGPILEAQILAAQAFGAAKTFFLVNGSTIGNIALALTLTKPNKKVLVSRNCHRSITNGLMLSGADPIWLCPEKLQEWSIWGAIQPKEIEKAIEENPDLSLVWITNPTYEGIVSDISAISKICKNHNIPLLVDEAHGSLWKFNERLPQTALELGADAVVNSLHKTGGSSSQSSMLHVAKDSLINTKELESNLKMLHTTSPSYSLLASLDAARSYLTSSEGLCKIESSVQNALYVRDRLSKTSGVKVLSGNNNFKIDPTKIYIMIEGLTGKRLESLLNFEFNIELESATDNGILALSNIGNTTSELEYFCECLESVVSRNFSDLNHIEKTKYMPLLTPKTILSPKKAFHMEKEEVDVSNSVGRLAGELIAECPPGIFVFVPGELITKDHLPYLTEYKTITVLKQ